MTDPPSSVGSSVGLLVRGTPGAVAIGTVRVLDEGDAAALRAVRAASETLRERWPEDAWSRRISKWKRQLDKERESKGGQVEEQNQGGN